jgi:flagellin
MRINTNVASLNALESNSITNTNLKKSLEKLSSGLRINKAADDASGLAIADKLRTQASSVSQAIKNASSGIALVQIADKAMAEDSNILDIVKQKLIQAGTATTTSAGRNAIAKDIKKLLEQVDNIASQTNYNGLYLLQKTSTSTSQTSTLTFQMGELSSDIITTDGGIRANTSGLLLTSLKNIVESDTDGTTLKQSTAQKLMDSIDNALNSLNKWRANFGSTQNQLESATRNMMTQVTNIKAAESVIRDVDYAEESANFNKYNIIAQAGTYAMSQANQVQQNVLKLLQ